MNTDVITERTVDERARISALAGCCRVAKHKEGGRSYGICVKICPARRFCSQPPRIRRSINHAIMEEPDFEDAGDAESLPDSALGNSRSLKSDDTESGVSFLDETAEVVANQTSKYQASSSARSERNKDLFDLLVSHFFGTKRSDEQEKKTQPRASLTRSASESCNRGTAWRTLIAQRTAVRSNRRSLSVLPNRRNRLFRTLLKRRTSTPESRLISSQHSWTSALSLGVSQIRILGESNLKYTKRLADKQRNSADDKAELRSTQAHPPTPDFSAYTKRTTTEQNSDSIRELKRPASVHMPLPNARRSDFPAVASYQCHEEPRSHRPRPDKLRHSNDSQNTLDRMTAGSLNRRRTSKKRLRDRFDDTIRSATQLSTSQARPRSASGTAPLDYARRDAGERKSPSESEPSVNYSSVTNGYDKRSPRRTGRSLSSAIDCVEINSVRSLSGDSPVRVATDSGSSLGAQDEVEREVFAPSKFDVKSASNEDHRSATNLDTGCEDPFTLKLVLAMRELKSIAGMARNVDEEEDEDWLSMFIGDLDHRLRYLMKLENGFCMDKEKLLQKTAVSEVSHQLISFLRDRLTDRTFRNDIETGHDASAQRSVSRSPYEMRKWQRHLANLVSTLDKYIAMLQKEPKAPRPKSRLCDGVTDYSQYSEEKRKAGDDFSDLRRNIEARRRSLGHSSSRRLLCHQCPPSHDGGEGDRNPVSNNEANMLVVSRPVWTLPVLDLRDDKNAAAEISCPVNLATFVKESRVVRGLNFADGESFPNEHPPQPDNVHSLSPDSRSTPTPLTEAVTSAYCRFPDNPKRNSDGVDLKINRHTAEFRTVVGAAEVAVGRTLTGTQFPTAASVAHRHPRSTSVSGTRPKVCPLFQSSLPSSAQSKVSSNFDSDVGDQRQPTTSSTQCDVGVRSRQKGQIGKEKLKRLKNFLKAGRDGAMQERCENERKMSIPQARLESLEKSARTQEGEKGAVEDEVERLNLLPKEKTVESAEGSAFFERRLWESDKKLESEKKRYERMSETVDDLQRQLIASLKCGEQIAEEKETAERKIHDLTIALTCEREHSARLQEENVRLESELEASNNQLTRETKNADKGKPCQKVSSANPDVLSIKIENKHQFVEMAEGMFESHDKLQQNMEELENENEKLNRENQELVGALSHEQMMSKDLARCYLGQVEYLNLELKVNKERSQAQKEQYEKEITRLLSEGGGPASDRPLGKRRTEEFQNEEPRNKGEEKRTEDGYSVETVGEDKAIQAEDLAYTRMRAFDWYSSRAQQDVRRLDDIGRRLEREIDAARDMVNC